MTGVPTTRGDGWAGWLRSRLDNLTRMSDDELDDQGLPPPNSVGYSLQEAFDREMDRQIIRGVRLGVAFALALIPVFAFLDYYRVPSGALNAVWAVRFVGWLIMVLWYWAGGWSWSKRHPRLFGVLAPYLCALSFIVMTLLFEPGKNPYYAGVNLVLIGTIIIPWGFTPTALASSTVWLTYLLSHVLTGSLEGASPALLSDFITNNFFMASTGILASGVSWYNQNLRFEAFRARYQQNRAYNELHLANEQLNRQHLQVQAQRQELAEANRMLEQQKTEIEQANHVLEQQKTEIEQANHVLEQQKTEIEQANHVLEQQKTEIEQTNRNLEQVNHLLAQQKQEIEQSKHEVEEANRILAEQYRYKSQFLDNMSHELRTPLTCIITPLDALLAGNVQGEMRQYLRDMQAPAHQLKELIDDLLDVSKYQNREVPLHRERVDMSTMVRDITASWRFTAQQKRLALTIEAPDDLPPVWIDRKEMGKVVRNLVSNAVKFTPSGGAVTVRLSIQGEMLELAVTDTGPGIPEEVLPKLFTPFFQVDGSQTRANEGTGLGLALVKQIAERHGGRVMPVQSQVGRGTTVAIQVPIGDAHVSEEARQAEEPSIINVPGPMQPIVLESWEQVSGGFGDSDVQGFSIRHLNDAFPGLDGKPTLLVVEDNPHLVDLLARILSPYYEVLTAGDGVEGLEKIYAHKPELVLSDVMMPRMTGFQLLEHVRKDKSLEGLPFIILTAKADGPDRVQGLWSGASDYLTKPFIPQELLARVHNLLHLRRFQVFLQRYNESLLGRSESLEGQLRQFFINTVRTLVKAIDVKDYYTGGHSERVAFFSTMLAGPFNFSESEMQLLELGALMHDVGKIGVPDHVLNKPAELTPEEVEIIRLHPLHSQRILETAPELEEVRKIAVQHHERWDGKGYPYQLKGAESSLMARIVSMADCWDAMVSDRVYRPGMDPEIAVSKIKKMAGTQIDPAVVDALMQTWPGMVKIPDHLRPLKPRKSPSCDREPRVGQIL